MGDHNKRNDKLKSNTKKGTNSAISQETAGIPYQHKSWQFDPSKDHNLYKKDTIHCPVLKNHEKAPGTTYKQELRKIYGETLEEAYEKALEMAKLQVIELNKVSKHHNVRIEFNEGFSETMVDQIHYVAVECEAKITATVRRANNTTCSSSKYTVEINLDDPKVEKNLHGPWGAHVGYKVRLIEKDGVGAGNKDNRAISGHVLINSPPEYLGVTLASRPKNKPSDPPAGVKLRTGKDQKEDQNEWESRKNMRPESSHWKDMFKTLNKIINKEKPLPAPESDLSVVATESYMKTPQSFRERG